MKIDEYGIMCMRGGNSVHGHSFNLSSHPDFDEDQMFALH